MLHCMNLGRCFAVVLIALLSMLPLEGFAAETRVENHGVVGFGWARAWVDVDGDGRDDLCSLSGLFELDLDCSLSKPDGFTTVKYSALWPGQTQPIRSAPRWVDLNGDGFLDVCRFVQTVGYRVACRFGPSFGTGFEIAVSLAYRTRDCTGAGRGMTCSAWRVEPGASPASNGLRYLATTTNVTPVYGYDVEPEFYSFSDVNGDQVPDFCVLHRQGLDSYFAMRCRIATLGAGRATVTYGPVVASWNRQIAPGASGWPANFADFNADGLMDYCRVLPGGTLSCLLSSTAGFLAQEAATASPVLHGPREGASFVDVNADGNTDFCRVVPVATPGLADHQLACTLSDGMAWLHSGGTYDSSELFSSALGDAGNIHSRWWVDVNGDGYPDYCRLASSPDPFPLQMSEGDLAGLGTSVTGSSLLCRLGRGGAATIGQAFAMSDVVLTNLDIGRQEGGRGFCDPKGTGIPTFCRVTGRFVDPPEQICGEHGDGGGVVCNNVYQHTSGFLQGVPGAPLGEQPLLLSYSDGAGSATRITYLPLTSNRIYARSNTTSNTDLRVLLAQPRSAAVYETRTWRESAGSDDPTLAFTGLARYFYKDLRVDVDGGSRGFRERWQYHEGNNTLDHTVFYQGLGPSIDADSLLHDPREVGMAKCQEKYLVQPSLIPDLTNIPQAVVGTRVGRMMALTAAIPRPMVGSECAPINNSPGGDQPFILLSATHHVLGTTLPQSNPRFRPVVQSTAHTWDWRSGISGQGGTRVRLPTTVTSTTTSDLGNVTQMVQTTTDPAGLTWTKTTDNTYTDNKPAWLLGRLTRAKVTASTPNATAQLAAAPRSPGSSENASAMSLTSPPPTIPTPMPPGVLAAIIDLILQD